MAKLLIDTSSYIPLLRTGRAPMLRHARDALYMSVVVAQELLAGAEDETTERSLRRLVDAFRQEHRLVPVRTDDWLECGRVLARIGKRHGYETIRRSRLVNDVLIALSCQDIKAVLITANTKDFALIAKFIPIQFADEYF